MEADLLEIGIDLLTLGDGLSYRRLGVLLARSDTRFMRAYNPDSEWTAQMYLLAVIADRLAVVSWQLQGDAKAPYPQQVQRPGVASGKRHGKSKPLHDVQGFFRRREERWRQN